MKRLSYLSLLIVFCAIISCSTQKGQAVIFHEEVENGKQLDLSILKSPEWFVKHRSENTADKLNNWIIVNNSKPNYVYYGKIDLQSDKLNRLKAFYKVPRESLEKTFPKYLSLDGVALNGIVYVEHIKPIIKENLASICPDRYTINYQDKYFRLKPEGIQAIVVMDAFCFNKPKKTYRLDILLDKSNLKEISKKVVKS